MKTDEELARAFREGDDLAFVALYQRHKTALHALCLKLVGEPETARDMVQEAFLRVFAGRRALARPEKFRSWLFAIAANACRSRLRVAGRETEISDDLSGPESLDPQETTELGEETRLVRDAIARLKPELREALVLREYGHLSYREIAEATGESESLVKARLFRARSRLHQILGPRMAERSEP